MPAFTTLRLTPIFAASSRSGGSRSPACDGVRDDAGALFPTWNISLRLFEFRVRLNSMAHRSSLKRILTINRDK